MIYKGIIALVGSRLVSQCSKCSSRSLPTLLNVTQPPGITQMARNFRWRAVEDTLESKYLIVGLGNLDMPHTRHSVGMTAVDELAEQLHVRWMRDRTVQGYVCSAYITDDTELVLLKSKLPMNDNGRSVHRAAHKWGISADSVYLLHDELDKGLGKAVFKNGGSSGGHNGVKSAIASMKTEEMPRIRIGINQPTTSDVVEFVLHRFKPEERLLVHQGTQEALWILLKHIQRRIRCEDDLPGEILGF